MRTGIAFLMVGLAGCAHGQSCKVRETALPEAQGIRAEASSLLPAMPVASTGATRGQAQELPPGATIVPTSGLPDPAGQVAVRIRAHVNGAPILDEELREAMVLRTGELMNVPETRRASFVQELAVRELDRLIERELILQEAMQKIKEIKRPQLLEQLKLEAGKEADRRIADIKKSAKISNDDEFRAFLRQSGLSVEGLRRQTERNFMMTEYIRNLIFPAVQRISVQQVREYYDEHPDQFTRPDRLKWMDIFIDISRFPDANAARRHAEMIIARAQAGENFAELVKQFDQGDSVLRGGEGLGNKPGEVKPPQAEPVLMSLKPGQVGPVIDLGFGLHVVKVIERDYAGPEPLDEKCQARVRDRLKGQIAEREYKRIVDELKRKATIVVYKEQ
ncbi:MAG: peptidyl-prolyl cis-trans isomerase [Gemmataceae bacterium]|nr:peptidyl-prolyl cis-trans isomerase [Gemmataceae bacterium]